jgi:hypothetical protein
MNPKSEEIGSDDHYRCLTQDIRIPHLITILGENYDKAHDDHMPQSNE